MKQDCPPSFGAGGMERTQAWDTHSAVFRAPVFFFWGGARTGDGDVHGRWGTKDWKGDPLKKGTSEDVRTIGKRSRPGAMRQDPAFSFPSVWASLWQNKGGRAGDCEC